MSSSSAFRLSVLVSGRGLQELPCSTICLSEHGNYAELWLRCNSILELLSSLRSLASTGVVLAVGGVDGRVFRFLPRGLDELVGATSRATIVQPGTIVVQPCDGNLQRVFSALAHYALRITLKRGSTRAKAMLARPLGVDTLFDSGVRLLKPLTVPPLLVRPPRRRSESSTNSLGSGIEP